VTIVLLVGLLLPSGSALAQDHTPPVATDDPRTLLENIYWLQPNGRSVETLKDKGNPAAIPQIDEAPTLMTGFSNTLVASSSIVNGDFEQGQYVGWSEYSSNGYDVVVPYTPGPGVPPHSGTWIAWLGDDYNEIAALSQNFTVPPYGVVRLWYWSGSEDACGYDYGTVKINSTIVYVWNLCYSTNTYGWTSVQIDISSYQGQMANLIIGVTTDDSLLSGLLIDDVSVESSRYTISGNAGVAGATLSYTDIIPKTVTSDASGNYLIDLPSGWSGTITPSKTGYTFTPGSKSYTNLSFNMVGQDYTANLITYTISGNAGVAGATLTYTNGTPMFVEADGTGNYSITLPMGWTGTVTPYRIGYSFTPSSRSYNSGLAANQVNQNYTADVCASCADKDTVGVFRPTNGLLYLKNANITGYADVAINYGMGGDYPITGDWDGDGIDTIGVYRNGAFYLRNSNTVGYADVYFAFGAPGDQPIAGDWDGDGTDTIGVLRGNTFYLRNSNTAGDADHVFQLGVPGDIGIAGDWTNQGFDTVGVFRPTNGFMYLKNTNTTGYADIALNYGMGGDKPVVGDWDNNGTDTIGVLRGNMFYLRNSNTVGYADMSFALGIPGDLPIAGNWDALP
jgi:hypothetical protein